VKTPNNSTERIRLGIVANEFFSPGAGGMGGFGWAASQVAKLFNQNPEHGVEVVFLNRTLSLEEAASSLRVHNTPLITRDGGRLASVRRLRALKLDLILMIDYRPSYRFFAGALPRTPIIVWVRDPRPAEDVREINTLRIPGAKGAKAQGADEVDCTSLAKIVRASSVLGRQVLFATPAPGLTSKIPGTYGVTPREVTLLPNPILPASIEITKSARPLVIFLGRLDPIKRPWLFTKLAEQFPAVDFIVMGQPHFEGQGAWLPFDSPANVRLLGHVDGEEKAKLLASAWALVNTSIHEALAVSFLEALASETPIISCQNPEDLVSRFGIYVGRWAGDGLAGLSKFVEALERLLQETALRVSLGKQGRAWVEETHSPALFLQAFRSLCESAGVRRR
jgi:glycosyltransferase involved in cell wall biosynthesis